MKNKTKILSLFFVFVILVGLFVIPASATDSTTDIVTTDNLNLTNLSGIVWKIPSGFSVPSSYGYFQINYTIKYRASDDSNVNIRYTSAYLGLGTDGVNSSPDTIFVIYNGEPADEPVGVVDALYIYGGADIDNPLLINWLVNNAIPISLPRSFDFTFNFDVTTTQRYPSFYVRAYDFYSITNAGTITSASSQFINGAASYSVSTSNLTPFYDDVVGAYYYEFNAKCSVNFVPTYSVYSKYGDLVSSSNFNDTDYPFLSYGDRVVFDLGGDNGSETTKYYRFYFDYHSVANSQQQVRLFLGSPDFSIFDSFPYVVDGLNIDMGNMVNSNVINLSSVTITDGYLTSSNDDWIVRHGDWFVPSYQLWFINAPITDPSLLEFVEQNSVLIDVYDPVDWLAYGDVIGDYFYEYGVDAGYSEGYDDGYSEGLVDGYEDGYDVAASEDFGENLLGATLRAPIDALSSFVLYTTSSGIEISLWFVLGAVIGLSLLIWFLKMFAGG